MSCTCPRSEKVEKDEMKRLSGGGVMNRSHDENRPNSALCSALFDSERQQTAGSGRGNNRSTSAFSLSSEVDEGRKEHLGR